MEINSAQKIIKWNKVNGITRYYLVLQFSLTYSYFFKNHRPLSVYKGYCKPYFNKLMKTNNNAVNKQWYNDYNQVMNELECLV